MLQSLALAAALFAPPTAGCKAAVALFRGVRAHTGGARWDTAKELVAEGTLVAAGLPGRTRMTTDLEGGATSIEDDQGIVRTRTVSSASMTWRRDLTQGVHRLDAPDARAAARTSAYLARKGYFRPATDPASFTCLSDVVEDGMTMRRVRIVPRGGRPVVVWVDPAAHVMVRTQQQAPTNLKTEHLGAYRRTGGLLLPHEIVDTDSRAGDTTVRSIRSYRVQRTRTAADFERPPEPGNQRLRNDAVSTQVPLSVEFGKPVVDAFIDGHGPLPFILDTGGHAILTADAAKALGIVARGAGVSGGGGEGTITTQFAHVRQLRLGDAEITDFPMYIIPYGKDFSDRANGKPPLAGILGVEIFERFVVTVDYARRTVQLRSPVGYVHHGDRDVAVPLLFQSDMPLVYAVADGARGLFGLDTGNSGRIILFGDFLHHHGFFERYTDGAAQQGSGTGGVVKSSSFRLRAFTFGGLTMHDFVTGFVVQQRGAFSSRTEAGNIGFDVLSHFTLTTDYGHGVMYLHPEPNAPMAEYTRIGFTGGFGSDAQGRPVVRAVLPKSPAAEAGLTTGDVILAIDDTPTQNLPYSRVAPLLRRPAGTSLRLTVTTNGVQRDVTLVLRELLCNPGALRCGPWIEPAH